MSGPELGYAALLVAAGVIAGWVNTLAGGGSLLTVPALMLYGLPADLANGTSRIAILTQSATGAYGYQRAGKLDRGALGAVAGPVVAGALLGAYAATLIPNAIFRPLLVGTMLVMALTLFLRPATLTPPEGAEPVHPRERPGVALPALFLTGLYGGFLQAGVGLMLLAVFGGLLRYDMVRGNALKVSVVLTYSVLVVGVFVWRDHVAWLPGIILAAGNAIGARLGVRFAIARGQAAIKKVVFAMVVVTCAAVLWK